MTHNPIHDEKSILENIEDLRQELRASRKTRHKAEVALSDADREVIADAEEAASEAHAKVNRLAEEKEEAEESLASLNHRLDNGDESVTNESLTNARSNIDRATRLIAPAKVALAKTQRSLTPFLADSHLALLAAEAVEEVTDTPVIITKTSTPEDVGDAIVLSQTVPTEGYGTIFTSGKVNISTLGSAALPGALVSDVLRAQGCEVSVSKGSILFDLARWSTPPLSRPAASAMARIGNRFEATFADEVSGLAQVQDLLEKGYNAREIKSNHEGLSHVTDASIDVDREAGKVTGTLKALVSSRDIKRWHPVDFSEVKDDATSAFNALKNSLTGTTTEAGKVTDLSLVEIKRVHLEDWEGTDLFQKIAGSPVIPIVGEVSISVTFDFVATEGA